MGALERSERHAGWARECSATGCSLGRLDVRRAARCSCPAPEEDETLGAEDPVQIRAR
jgi:hypothetical protein